jgi:hypothetical protein
LASSEAASFAGAFVEIEKIRKKERTTITQKMEKYRCFCMRHLLFIITIRVVAQIHFRFGNRPYINIPVSANTFDDEETLL